MTILGKGKNMKTKYNILVNIESFTLEDNGDENDHMDEGSYRIPFVTDTMEEAEKKIEQIVEFCKGI